MSLVDYQIRPYSFSAPILLLGTPTADGRLITGWPPAWNPRTVFSLTSDQAFDSGQPRACAFLPSDRPGCTAHKIGDVTHLARVGDTVHAFGILYLDRVNLNRIRSGLSLPEPDLCKIVSQPALRDFSFGARTEITDWRLSALHLGTKPVWDLPPVSLWEA